MAKPESVIMLKNLLAEVLGKMTFKGFTIGVREDSSAGEENLIFNIASEQADLLIGQYGANLRALEHILRAVARRRTEEKLRFSIDVNNYRKERLKSLEEIAVSAARQAIEEKRAVVLRPMSAYERRIVHMALAENKDVQTESIGEGEERKVVVKSAGEIEKV